MPEMRSQPNSQRKQSTRGAETERRFIAAANEVFWARGFAGTTIAHIVEASGLSVGSFYHLFKDKAVLLTRATVCVMDDFRDIQQSLKLDRASNRNLQEMLYRLTLAGRKLVARNRGIYRAMSELAQNDVAGFGQMREIGPTTVKAVAQVIDQYSDELGFCPNRQALAHAVQLIAMSVLQTELGLGPLYPRDVRAFSHVVARGAYGILALSRTAQSASRGITKES